MAQVLERSPVAAVQGVGLLHVDRSAYQTLAFERGDEAEPVPEAIAQQLEQAPVQVLAAPRVRAHGRAVDLEDGAEELVRDRGPREGLDAHALPLERAPLALHLVAALRA